MIAIGTAQGHFARIDLVHVESEHRFGAFVGHFHQLRKRCRHAFGRQHVVAHTDQTVEMGGGEGQAGFFDAFQKGLRLQAQGLVLAAEAKLVVIDASFHLSGSVFQRNVAVGRFASARLFAHEFLVRLASASLALISGNPGHGRTGVEHYLKALRRSSEGYFAVIFGVMNVVEFFVEGLAISRGQVVFVAKGIRVRVVFIEGTVGVSFPF